MKNRIPSNKEPVLEAPRSQELPDLSRIKVKTPKLIEPNEPVYHKPCLTAYFCTCKINTKGVRKEVGFIIQAINETEALSVFNLRLKKEFSGIRNITFSRIRLMNEDDKEYVNDIEVVTKIVSDESKTESNKDTNNEQNETSKNDLVSSFLAELPEHLRNKNIYRVVFTPGRKPRKRDYDKNFFIVMADTLTEAKTEARAEIESMGLPFKEKFALFQKDTVEEIAKSTRFKKFLDRQKNKSNSTSEDLTTNKPLKLQNLNTLNDDYDGGLYTSNSGYKVETDEVTGQITSITLTGVNIFDQGNFKKYIITPSNSIKKYNPIEISAISPSNALIAVSKVITSVKIFKQIYALVESFTIQDVETKKIGIVPAKLMHK